MFHRGAVRGLVTSTPLRYRWTLQHRHVSTDQHAAPPLVTPPPPQQPLVVPLPPPSPLSSSSSSSLPPPPLPPTPPPSPPPGQDSQPLRLADRIPEEYWKRLDEWKDSVDKRAKELAVSAGKNLAIVGLKVNEATGYREVERLKLAVKQREQELSSRRIEVKGAKAAYEEAVSTRTSSQQNVNSLLERKHSWTDSDVASFTTLVRSDHASRHAVTTTSEELKAAELAVDKSFTALMQAILERYHEEQVWSDKIRSVSTWASIVALAANLIVFVGAIAFVEPWKRRRLVEGLEARMTGMMERVDSELQTLSSSVGGLESRLAPAAVSSTAGTAATGAAATAATATATTVTNPVEEDAVAATPPPSSSTSPSPIEQLSEQVPPTSQQSKVLSWVSSQLAHVSPPSIERDLAAASLVGAVGGAVTVGLVSLVFSSLRG